MAQIFNSSGQTGALDISIESTQYDVLKNLVQSKVSDPALWPEYIAAYTMIAQNLNISVGEFAELLRSQGSDYQQDAYLAAYMNQYRVANARIGIALDLSTPVHVLREIRA
jgi:hypothetical protein